MSNDSRAQRLRGRMSIDPDAPEHVTRPLAPVADPPVGHDPGPAHKASSPPPVDSRATDLVDEPPDHPADAETPTTSKPSLPQRSRGVRRRKPGTGKGDGPKWSTALDDPAINSERNGYRSFYVGDAVFARFRAAIYWTARRDDAMDEVPDNMSAAIEEYMETVASDLERRFNDGAVFRPTPDQVKAHRRRLDKG